MKKFVTAILVFLPLSINAQWEILNEGFKGQINSIDFVNENVGWLAGSNGTLVKTTDSGEKWNNISRNNSWNINQIDFISEDFGWAIGRAGSYPNVTNYIWKSSNGGNTWVQQFSSTDFDFNSLYVIDTTNVFAVGGNKIYKTSNGGTNWINVSPNLPDKNYNSLWFQNPEIGVVVGSYNDGITDRGIILKTTNGGINWNETIVNEFNSIYDLQCLDNTNGYFRAHLDTTHYICKTEDMFTSWNIITQIPALNYQLWGTPEPIRSYQYLDQNTAYAIMDDSISSNNVMKSIDGGISWQKDQSIHFWSNKIYFNSTGVGFVLSNFPINKNEKRGILLKSIDGNSWYIQKFYYLLNDVHFINENKGFICGGNFIMAHFDPLGNIFSTVDGGISWNWNYEFNAIAKSFSFLNDFIGFSIVINVSRGVTSIYKTINSGNNWALVYKNNLDSMGYYFSGNDLGLVDEQNGFAVGRYNMTDYTSSGAGILSTTDYGENWDIVWKDTTASELFSICNAFANSWSVGESGLIVKYNPQIGWIKQPSVTDLPLNKVFFSDDDHGWIVGGYQNSNGFQKILLKTINAGVNWNTVPNVPYLIRDIAFIDNNLGWAVGYTQSGSGGILKTTDGGNSWVIDTGNLSSKLNALFIKNNYGWAVGENGLILRTTDAGTVWVEDENNNTYPTEYMLEQNYPNPFNPSTSIQYKIGSGQIVTLKVYDVLGREVATLVNEEQPKGVYDVEFDSKALSSGIYFYTLRTGSYTATKKMILLK